MSQRHNVKRYESDDVQGEGSFVEVKEITYGESKAMRQRVATAQTDDERMQLGENIISTYVLNWNWVGDDGETLNLPKNDPSVIDQLTGTEVAFLTDCINGQREAKKKVTNS